MANTLLLEVTVQNPVTSLWTVTFSTYGSVCLEFFLTITCETILQPPSFWKHLLSIFISCWSKQLSGQLSIQVYVRFTEAATEPDTSSSN